MTDFLDATNPDTPADVDLGRLLFEKRPQSHEVAVPAVISIVALGFALACLSLWLLNGAVDQEALLFGCGAFIASILVGSHALAQGKTVLRVCEYGLSQESLFRRMDVRYDQVDSFTFNCTRQYLHGTYAGTRYYVHFVVGAKSLSFTATFAKGADRQLDGLRDSVSGIIAERLSNQLDQRGEAPWTNQLRLVPEGVEYRYKSEWHLVPFRQLGTCEIDNGVFYLRERFSEIPLMQEHVLVPNFFPGLVVFRERAFAQQGLTVSPAVERLTQLIRQSRISPDEVAVLKRLLDEKSTNRE